jgi:hypothetical protein
MANVKLSAAELELVCNAEIILTKNNIIKTVYDLFGELSIFYINEVNKHESLNKVISSVPPKISRGENYEGLPWVMLDYPRYFARNDEFAIRTYFWWGNFCSITLQISGGFREKYQTVLKKIDKSIETEGWFVCCNEDKWQHHFREDNYKPVSSFSEEEIERLTFIKLAKKIPLNQWDSIEIFLKENFTSILDLL